MRKAEPGPPVKPRQGRKEGSVGTEGQDPLAASARYHRAREGLRALEARDPSPPFNAVNTKGGGAIPPPLHRHDVSEEKGPSRPPCF